jgi:hypothetical protein
MTRDLPLPFAGQRRVSGGATNPCTAALISDTTKVETLSNTEWVAPVLPCSPANLDVVCGDEKYNKTTVPTTVVHEACSVAAQKISTIDINPVTFDHRPWSGSVSKDFLSEIKYRVAQVTGASSAGKGTAHSVSQTNSVDPCTVELPIEYDLDRAIISTVPPGSRGEFPLATLRAQGWDIEELYRPVSAHVSRATVAATLDEYMYTSTGITGPYDAAHDIYGTVPVAFNTTFHCLDEDHPLRGNFSNYAYSSDGQTQCQASTVGTVCTRTGPKEAYDISCVDVPPNAIGWNACNTDCASSFTVISPAFWEGSDPNPTTAKNMPPGSFFSPYYLIPTDTLLRNIADYHNFSPFVDTGAFAQEVFVANLAYRDKSLEISECPDKDKQQRTIGPQGASCSEDTFKRIGVAAPWTYWSEDGAVQYNGGPSNALSFDTTQLWSGAEGQPVYDPLALDKEGKAIGNLENLKVNTCYMRTYPVDMRDQNNGPGPYIATMMQPQKDKLTGKAISKPGVSLFVGYNQGPELDHMREGCMRYIIMLCYLFAQEGLHHKPAGVYIDDLGLIHDSKDNPSLEADFKRQSGFLREALALSDSKTGRRRALACMTYAALESLAQSYGRDFTSIDLVFDDKKKKSSECRGIIQTACVNAGKSGLCADKKVNASTAWGKNTNAGRRLPNWGANPIFVYAPPMRKIDIGAGITTRVQRARQVVRHKPGGVGLCPDASATVLNHVKRTRVPTLMASVPRAMESGALTPLPRAMASSSTLGNHACASADAGSEITTIARDVPWLRDQFLGLFYDVTVARDANGHRTGLTTPSDKSGAESDGMRGLLATALTAGESQSDVNNDADDARRVPRSAVGAPATVPVTSALAVGLPHADCAMLTTPIGAINYEDRLYYSRMVRDSGSSLDGIACMTPVCTVPSPLAPTMRAPQARACPVSTSLCLSHTTVANNVAQGSINIHRTVDLNCTKNEDNVGSSN